MSKRCRFDNVDRSFYESAKYRIESLVKTVYGEDDTLQLMEIEQMVHDGLDEFAINEELIELEAKQVLPKNLKNRFKNCYDRMHKIHQKLKAIKPTKEVEDLDEKTNVLRYSTLASPLEAMMDDLKAQISQRDYNDEKMFIDNLSNLVFLEEAMLRLETFLQHLIDGCKNKRGLQ